MSDKDSVNPEERTSSLLAQRGIKATKVYFILLFAFLFPAYSMGWLELKPITLNEIGDFLAGVFGPLSIFWLVLGFFQQGSELRLQVTELANSVAQQKEMVNVSRETLDHERGLVGIREAERKERARPKFTIDNFVVSPPDKGELRAVRMRLVNVGSQLSEVEVKLEPAQTSGSTANVPFWKNGDDLEIGVALPHLKLKDGIKLLISCVDLEGEHHSLVYFSPLNDDDMSELRLLPKAQDTASSGGAGCQETHTP